MNDNLAQDFVALWQSELTAMAADREMREAWAKLLQLWALATSTVLGGLPHDLTPRGSGPAQPAGAAPAAAASGARLDEIERLNRRVAELEQRLADLSGGGNSGTGNVA